ncbi:MAG TPA: saccharopine dehydrogenase NADP-binding domain-containing protein [Polyangiales bacterium]
MTRARVHDVVIFGATGFTGGLVARYFAREVSLDRTPWAIAGRNREKLLALRDQLTQLNPACAQVPIVVAQSDDKASLAAMAKNARVVITTVGPFAHYGEPLFAVCAEHGTDYIDSTGEFSFVRNMRARYGQLANESGAIMVSCCGMDSIPTDLGLYYTMKQLAAAGQGDGPTTVEGLFAMRMRPSGGTWNSMLSVFGDLGQVPAYVPPPPARDGRKIARVEGKLHRDREFGWVVPFTTVDPEIALHSAAELPVYGSDFSYTHYLVSRSLSRALGLGVGMGTVALIARLALGRKLLGRALVSGEGPSEAERARNWFKLRFRARRGDLLLQTQVRGGDPGYDETAKMLSESALCLAVDRARLPAQRGVLTPACALGDVLLTRLMRAGLVFETLQ